MDDSPTHIYLSEDGTSGQLGPYKLLQQLGEGGMGTVYMAEQEEPVRRRVALKVIKPGMDSRQVIARFEAERQALAMMDHQNIARVLDAGTTDDQRPYFVMELVQGIPITDYCDRNRLTLSERLSLFTAVCRAIQHAHQKGIIHRDIKPTNILVTMYDGEPVPKVIDFGLAKALQQRLTDRTMFTQFGQVVGTLEYMSPEQAEMNAVDVDTRTDVYSLGVLLYELLAGTTPLQKQTLKEQAFDRVLQIIREEDPPKPSTRLSESGDALAGISAQRQLEPHRLSQVLRGDLDWIVMKALEKERARRYETASNFAADIERYLSHEPIEARPPSAMYRMQKLVRRHFAAVVTGIAFVLLLCGSAATSIWLAVRAHDAEREVAALLDNEKSARAAAETARALAEERLQQMEEAREAERKLRVVAEEQRDRAIAAEERARSEATVAAAVNDLFQVNLFDPPAEESEEPAGLGAFGSLVDKAGELIGDEDAQAFAEAALRLSSSNPTMSAGYSLASAARHLAQLRETEQSLHKLIDAQRKRIAAEGSDLAARTTLATYLTMLANVQLNQKRFEESATAARESIALQQQHDQVDWRLFQTRSLLGAALIGLDRLDEAEPLLIDAWKGSLERRDEIPRNNRGKHLAATARRLADLYERQGNRAEAETWRERAREQETVSAG